MTYPNPEEQERDGAARQGRSQDRSQDRSGDDRKDKDTDAAFARIIAGLRAEPEEKDHFDPPEPPPLPIPRPRTIGGVLALIVGVLLLAGPNLLGVSERVGTPLGLFLLTAGIGWLVTGLRPDPPPEGSDDGARL